MTDILATMYTEDENDTPVTNKTPIPSTLGKYSSSGVKSYYIDIDGEKIEVVKKSYVEMIERDLLKVQRDLKTAQTRITQLLRAASAMSGDIKQLRSQFNARGRFD